MIITYKIKLSTVQKAVPACIKLTRAGWDLIPEFKDQAFMMRDNGVKQIVRGLDAERAMTLSMGTNPNLTTEVCCTLICTKDFPSIKEGMASIEKALDIDVVDEGSFSWRGNKDIEDRDCHIRLFGVKASSAWEAFEQCFSKHACFCNENCRAH